MKLENRYTKKQMIENINECILKLYENESKKAMEQVLVLLEQFQTMIENCNEDDNLSGKKKGTFFLHELLEQYKYGVYYNCRLFTKKCKTVYRRILRDKSEGE